MKQTKQPALIWSILILAGLGLAVMLVWPPLASQAGPELPPRNPPQPTAQPANPGKEAGGKGSQSQPGGAYIELQAPALPAGVWTVVQWQDSAGGWHNVEGWQGSLEAGQQKQWWVASGDFGKGPFRWVVTQGPGGPLLGTSQPFSLPRGANEVVRVIVGPGS